MDQIYLDSSDALPDFSAKTNENDLSQRSPSRHQHGAAQSSPLIGRDPFSASHRRNPSSRNLEARLSELESENLRLQRLVAELLIKNQQLRRSDV